MSKSRQITKLGSLTPQFKAAAVTDPEGALAYMFLAAFGVSLNMLTAIADKVFATKDASLVLLALVAGVQIRAHTVFVGAEYAGVKAKYPDLIIDSVRDQQDQFNFSALHVLGHVFAHAMVSSRGKAVLEKAGSAVTGDGVTDSEAGKINRELADGWTLDDRSAWRDWNGALSRENRKFLDDVAAAVTRKQKDFSAKINQPVTPPRPGTSTAASAGGSE